VGILGLAQPLALSTPLTSAQLPFPLFINGNEISGTVIATSYKLRDAGFGGPQLLMFTVRDTANTVSGWITKQQRVLWSDAVGGRYLFQGFVKNLKMTTHATWIDIDVTCADLSEVLDFARPITDYEAGGRSATDAGEIAAMVAQFATEPNLTSGGFLQIIAAGMPGSTPIQRTTLRNGIALILAETGNPAAVAYVDVLGHLHTLTTGDVAAPYAISDTPNYTTTIPALITITDEGSADVDAVYVYGATAAGSGAVYYNLGYTRSPMRWATVDAPASTDAASKGYAAVQEIQRRQQARTVSLVISGDSSHGGFDGWAKGQLITITNGPLRLSAATFTINSVDMEMISGMGLRRYTISAGSDPILFTARAAAAHARYRHKAIPALRVVGPLGTVPP